VGGSARESENDPEKGTFRRGGIALQGRRRSAELNAEAEAETGRARLESVEGRLGEWQQGSSVWLRACGTMPSDDTAGRDDLSPSNLAHGIFRLAELKARFVRA
jgi:hypothetical protein